MRILFFILFLSNLYAQESYLVIIPKIKKKSILSDRQMITLCQSLGHTKDLCLKSKNQKKISTKMTNKISVKDFMSFSGNPSKSIQFKFQYEHFKSFQKSKSPSSKELHKITKKYVKKFKKYKKVIVIVPDHTMEQAGVSLKLQNQGIMWIKVSHIDNSLVFIHEIGHLLGLTHPYQFIDGKIVELGDEHSVMSYQRKLTSFSGAQLDFLKWQKATVIESKNEIIELNALHLKKKVSSKSQLGNSTT